MMADKTHYLIGKYGGAVPRYTSFPTAAQFSDAYTHQLYTQDLSHLDAEKNISLYIHIPFCHSLCHYCGCNTKIVHKTNIISDYIESLCAEIRLAGQYIKSHPKINRIHFGGGSPNYAPIVDLQKVIKAIHDVFHLEDTPPIDMECDPRLLNNNKIIDLIKFGVKRFSFGVQDFDEDVQAAINRIQPFGLVQSQVLFLKENGIYDINFDLITGLPLQTISTIKKTLSLVTDLQPSRIAVFPYAHVPWMKKHQLLLEQYDLSDPYQRYHFTETIKQRLALAGYQEIGIDHYALPDDSLILAQSQKKMRRNFQGYSDDESRIILGFGLSAISQFDRSYAQNTVDALSYKNLIDAGIFPTKRGFTLSDTDLIHRDMIMTLMCDFEIDLGRYSLAFIPNAQLELFIQDGLIVYQDKKLKITDLGKSFTRVIAAAFDPYLSHQEQKHAKAI
jgi:oxygen-independent coproporphyrinogen-3 oxidase